MVWPYEKFRFEASEEEILSKINYDKRHCYCCCDFSSLETTSNSPYMYLMLDIPPSPLYKVCAKYFNKSCLLLFI